MANKPDLRGLLDNADDAAALLVAMAKRHRLLALIKLTQREICVGTLSDELGLSQPVVSHYLSVFKAQDLVSGRREGTSIHYGVSSLRVRPILATLARIYRGSGTRQRPDKRVIGQAKRDIG